MVSWRVAGIAWVWLVACGEAEPPPPPPPPAPPPAPAAPIVAARPIAARAAFELVALPDGAALAWGAPLDEGGGVRAMSLDPLGGARGHEVVVSRSAIAGQ